MLPAKRILVAAIGLPVLLALPGCGGVAGYGDNSNGTDNNTVSSTGTPQPNPDPSDAVNGVGSELQEPIGIPTDSLFGVAIPKMGNVVTDGKDWILYRFDKDTANPSVSNCSGKCAEIWPPVLTDGNPILTGVAREKVGTITREDGATQLTLGGWPLYRYIGDLKPGQWKGQMVGGTWFVAAPDGKKNLSCLPTITPTPAQPPAKAADPTTAPGETDGTGGTGAGY